MNKREVLSAEEFLMDCINHLVVNSDFNEGVDGILEKIGTYYQGGMVHLFKVDQDKMGIRNTNVWCVNQLDANPIGLDKMTPEEFKRCIEVLMIQSEMVIDQIEGASYLEKTVLEILRLEQVRSMILFAIKEDGKICGIISVHNYKKEIQGVKLLISLSNLLFAEWKRVEIAKELNYMGYHDMLTGVYNKNKYMEYLNGFTWESIKSIGIVFMDLNGLKEINDNYGHNNGDHAIMETSEVLKKYFRLGDIYRIGGDEFVIICEDIQEDIFKKKLEGIQEEFNHNWSFTISIGEVWAAEKIDIQTLVKRADEIMYQRKRDFYNEIQDYDDSVSMDLQRLIPYEDIVLNSFDGIYRINPLENSISVIYQSEQCGLLIQLKNTLSETFTYMIKMAIHPSDRKMIDEKFGLDVIENLKHSKSKLEMEFRGIGQNGKYHWISICMIASRFQSGELFVMMKNIDHLMNNERRIKDNLTDLYNFDAFCQKADKLLIHNVGSNYVLLMMDIDKFKLVNDIYGVQGGNKILLEISQILSQQVSERGICCRLYADVFYLLTEYQTEKDIEQLIDGITESLSKNAFEFNLVPSFGICRVGGRTNSTFLMCEQAGYAHKYVKSQRISRFMYYDENIKRHILEEKQMENDMDRALRENEFQVYLQPKYNTKYEKVVGAEALVRWQHPVKGLIPPSDFIPLFEKNGFILKLDMYVWEKTCQVIRKWIHMGLEAIPISVNVSRLHLQNLKFHSNVLNLFDTYNIPKHLLELELTESLFAEDLEYFGKIVQDLRKEHIIVDMDDFGSGYSSLHMLMNIPMDIVKIDCGFFNRDHITKREKIVLQYTIQMAKELSFQVVAEGVETQEQADFLREAECEVIQGHCYCQPIPISEFEQLVFGDLVDS